VGPTTGLVSSTLSAVFLVLLLLFILLPIAELYLIIQVGGAIGIWPTIALLLFDSFLGAVLLRSQGRLAWRRFQEVLRTSRVPAKEVYDGAAIIFGGALLLTPGFITDFFGFLLLIPPTRAALRRVLLTTARRVGPTRSFFFVFDRFPRGGGSRQEPRGGPSATGGWQSPPGGDPSPGGGPGRTYDFDGSAREIPDDAPELDPGAGEAPPAPKGD
jgi:UPF0716 protein FxsA